MKTHTSHPRLLTLACAAALGAPAAGLRAEKPPVADPTRPSKPDVMKSKAFRKAH